MEECLKSHLASSRPERQHESNRANRILFGITDERSYLFWRAQVKNVFKQRCDVGVSSWHFFAIRIAHATRRIPVSVKSQAKFKILFKQAVDIARGKDHEQRSQSKSCFSRYRQASAGSIQEPAGRGFRSIPAQRGCQIPVTVFIFHETSSWCHHHMALRLWRMKRRLRKRRWPLAMKNLQNFSARCRSKMINCFIMMPSSHWFGQLDAPHNLEDTVYG